MLLSLLRASTVNTALTIVVIRHDVEFFRTQIVYTRKGEGEGGGLKYCSITDPRSEKPSSNSSSTVSCDPARCT